MTRLLLMVFVAIIVGGGIFFATSIWEGGGPTSPILTDKGLVGNTAASDSFDVLVKVTQGGFEPQQITINVGERVRFLNTTDEGVWPASGIHPTHTLYPEKNTNDCLGSSFDACRDLKKGEFFNFTFNYEGTWRYHDHSHAYNGGSIIVQSSQ